MIDSSGFNQHFFPRPWKGSKNYPRKKKEIDPQATKQETLILCWWSHKNFPISMNKEDFLERRAHKRLRYI